MEKWQVILERQAQWNTENSEELRLTDKEAVILYRDAEFHALRKAADRRRKIMNPGNRVSYLVDRNINYTNICTINCQPTHPNSSQPFPNHSKPFQNLPKPCKP